MKQTTEVAVQGESQAPVTIQQLYSNPAVQLQREQLRTFLDQDPPVEWVKTHPNISNHRYVPIDKVEWMLKRFFKRYRVEVLDYRQLLNSISVHVRVHYEDPISGELTHHDGVGAWELQTAKDSGILKLDASNLNRGAVPMALGIAESIAIKDACDKIGNIFGANLNRKDTLPIMPDTQLQEVANSAEHNRMVRHIKQANTRAELEEYRDHCTTDELKQIFETKYNSVK